jgi:hypothetical protein
MVINYASSSIVYYHNNYYSTGHWSFGIHEGVEASMSEIATREQINGTGWNRTITD